MFCDLIGSTALSRQMGPEALFDVRRSFRIACAEVIHDHGGYVSRYMGDGILALFGYPTARESDTERAAHAELEITAAVAALRMPRHANLQLCASAWRRGW